MGDRPPYNPAFDESGLVRIVVGGMRLLGAKFELTAVLMEFSRSHFTF